MINCIGTLGSDDQGRGKISIPNGEEGGLASLLPGQPVSHEITVGVLASGANNGLESLSHRMSVGRHWMHVC